MALFGVGAGVGWLAFTQKLESNILKKYVTIELFNEKREHFYTKGQIHDVFMSYDNFKREMKILKKDFEIITNKLSEINNKLDRIEKEKTKY